MSETNQVAPAIWPNCARPTRPSYAPGPISQLPFINKSGKYTEWNHWSVAPADYATACTKGREYAAHLALYFKANPSVVDSNILGHVAADIDFADGTGTEGYWVGFFTFLERMIYHFSRDYDAWGYFEQVDKKYVAIAVAREQMEVRS